MINLGVLHKLLGLPWWLQRVKHLTTMRETWVRSLGQEDPLEKGMATHSCTLAWKIPWLEEPGRLQFMGSQRVRHDWATSLSHKLLILRMTSVWLWFLFFVYIYFNIFFNIFGIFLIYLIQFLLKEYFVLKIKLTIF